MKAISPPEIDNIHELQLLANNSRLSSYPDLMNEYLRIRQQYQSYVENGGNPWVINSINIGEPLKNSLKLHYLKPPKGRLSFIQKFRRNLSPLVCPMCGSFGNGSIDHYLPKDIYPEFSCFSHNLIPSCNCNSLRGTRVKGDFPSARAIHPYYDAFVQQRLYQSSFTGSFETPEISIEVINKDHPNLDILLFHLENVILNPATQGWFEKQWSTLALRPRDILALTLPDEPRAVTEFELKDAIKKYRDSKDTEYGTPNNWSSIFFTGLMLDSERLTKLAGAI
ncbi:hypothetical protein [Pseudidiomarina sp. YC-516-91]|uniref:hypothetical protein n=1 Tax=Pseudidiomarina salilacus TaxID=3384452 RepID=UPI00398561F7